MSGSTSNGPRPLHARAIRMDGVSGPTTNGVGEVSAELTQLKRENAELKRANAILKSASIFFAAKLDRPQPLIVRYIDEHVGVPDGEGLRWCVEPICTQLIELGTKIAPATYCEHRSRKPSAQEMRDEDLKPRIAAVHV